MQGNTQLQHTFGQQQQLYAGKCTSQQQLLRTPSALAQLETGLLADSEEAPVSGRAEQAQEPAGKGP
jgi:hypothetical protein